ncbi:hypothetical protein MMC30_004260 [Trapelia coarctata]|nr:hypothetical protein [Trapelia coarctata]
MSVSTEAHPRQHKLSTHPPVKRAQEHTIFPIDPASLLTDLPRNPPSPIHQYLQDQVRRDPPSFLDDRTPHQLRAICSLAVASTVIEANGDSTFVEFMHLAAKNLSGLKELKVSIAMFRSGWRRNGPWVKGVEAWMGRGLKVGLVKMKWPGVGPLQRP